MRTALLLSAATACLTAPAESQSPATCAAKPLYQIAYNPQVPSIVNVRLALPGTVLPTRLLSRAETLQTRSQVGEVRCGDTVIERSQASWNLPTDCSEVFWTVDLDRTDFGSVQPSAQRSLVTPAGWVLLSGSTSLLRVEGWEDEGFVSIEAHNNEPRCEILPPVSAPPAFFILGDAPSITYGAGTPQLRYVADDLEAVLGYVDPASHATAIDYLAAVIGEDQRRDVEELTVIWFGASRERRELSGAAGYDTLLANYLLPAETPSPLDVGLPFVLVLHEQFHQLAAGHNPVWVSESLATYYALKAARRILPEDEGVAAAWSQLVQTDASISIGLLEVQRQIEHEQDYGSYSLLYSQGASFWYALDEALQEGSNGARSLDGVLPVILAAEFEPDSPLPNEVHQQLAQIPAVQLGEIVNRYLTGSAH